MLSYSVSSANITVQLFILLLVYKLVDAALIAIDAVNKIRCGKILLRKYWCL